MLFRSKYDFSGTLNISYVDGFPWSSGIYYGTIDTYFLGDLHTNYKFNDHLAAMLSITWALSLYKSDDYRKAKIPMLPVTSGIQTTKKNILIYSIGLFLIVLASFYLQFSGLVYLLFSKNLKINKNQ